MHPSSICPLLRKVHVRFWGEKYSPAPSWAGPMSTLPPLSGSVISTSSVACEVRFSAVACEWAARPVCKPPEPLESFEDCEGKDVELTPSPRSQIVVGLCCDLAGNVGVEEPCRVACVQRSQARSLQAERADEVPTIVRVLVLLVALYEPQKRLSVADCPPARRC